MNLPPRPRPSYGTLALLAGLMALVAASFASLPLQWSAFFTVEAIGSAREFLAGFAPPDLAPSFLRKCLDALFERNPAIPN